MGSVMWEQRKMLRLAWALSAASSTLAQDCKGTTDCPLWPHEFSAEFGLHATVPPISNASSTFYYRYLADNSTRAQLIDYHTRCFPFVSTGTFFSSKPCKLLFRPEGIFFMQPARSIECCTFVKGVGAVPPAFLQAYTYQGTNKSAPDLYGNQVSCDYWTGPEGFKYWTTSHC